VIFFIILESASGGGWRLGFHRKTALELAGSSVFRVAAEELVSVMLNKVGTVIAKKSLDTFLSPHGSDPYSA